VLPVFEQCSNANVPSTEHGRLHNNNLSPQNTSSREATVKLCVEGERAYHSGERVESLVLCTSSTKYPDQVSDLVRPSYIASRYKSRPDLQGIIHRAESSIARHNASLGIVIARYSPSRGIIIVRHYPSHDIVIARNLLELKT
jgi:hypothetical protein